MEIHTNTLITLRRVPTLVSLPRVADMASLGPEDLKLSKALLQRLEHGLSRQDRKRDVSLGQAQHEIDLDKIRAAILAHAPLWEATGIPRMLRAHEQRREAGALAHQIRSEQFWARHLARENKKLERGRKRQSAAIEVAVRDALARLGFSSDALVLVVAHNHKQSTHRSQSVSHTP